MTSAELSWLIGSLAALHRLPFDPSLFTKQFPPPLSADAFERAAEAAGFRLRKVKIDPKRIARQRFPLVASAGESIEGSDAASVAIVLQADDERVLYVEPGRAEPVAISRSDFCLRFFGEAWSVSLASALPTDPDATGLNRQPFGFRWFVPELLKHRSIWREVILASLVLQLMALGTPLFTQAIIDKVVVHRTESTLIALAVGTAIFLIFTSALTWVRQYLILHTGNRVDAVLGSSVLEHVFKLPPIYFQHRPTGVIAARLHGVETIRDFIASAAVTLILDVPFLLIFVAIMFFYSAMLTAVVLGVLAVIVMMSLAVAPLFQSRLQQQFLLGARN